MILAFAYTNVAIMPLRSDPAHRAEQTTQLLFGEKAEILEVNSKEWAKIKCSNDGYVGWCKQSQLTEISKKEYQKKTKYIVTSNSSKIVIGNNEMWMPLGSELIGFKASEINIQKESGIFKGKKSVISELSFGTEIITTVSMKYLYAPYLWGGRSSAGIDCSGLTQLVYKMCNYKLPRNANQQALLGTSVDFLQNSILGDLAFFDDKDGNITHVGILLDNQTIIHASDSAGRVAIDRIDQGGIISLSLKRRTHQLRFVKRLIN